MAATELAEYRGSEARRVQINFDLELGDQIERAGAIEMIALRRRLTDARTPSPRRQIQTLSCPGARDHGVAFSRGTGLSGSKRS